VYFVASRLFRARIKKEIDQIEGLKYFFNGISSESMLPATFRSKVENKILSIICWRFVFDYLVSFRSTKCVFVLCYYSPWIYGLTLSAKNRSIRVIDMQHGTQSEFHSAYSGFAQFPSSGFNTVPSMFWTWDKSSFKNINQWINYERGHSVILGGNPWIEFLLRKRTDFQLTKVILYTLQPVGPILDDYIVESIRATPQEFEWWLRLHPRQLDQFERLKSFLEERGISKRVELAKALEVPLPVILMRAALHVSKYSGSIIEAAQLGVKSIVLGELGASIFVSEIESGCAISYLGTNPDDIVSLIKQHAGIRVNVDVTMTTSHALETVLKNENNC
jgi:hypothetical protein